MNLKVLLPFRVFAETKNVSRIILETSNGSYGLLPQRLDCVAALVAGIFTYETELQGIQYLAVDEGVMVKAGPKVLVSVRNAIGGTDLGHLQEMVEKEFKTRGESEQKNRFLMQKMESGFIHGFEKFLKE